MADNSGKNLQDRSDDQTDTNTGENLADDRSKGGRATASQTDVGMGSQTNEDLTDDLTEENVD